MRALPFFVNEKLSAVDVCEDDKSLLVEISNSLWGQLENDASWIVFLLEGKLGMISLQHCRNSSEEVCQYGLDAITRLTDLRERKYLTMVYPEHYWLDINGNKTELRDMEGMPIFRSIMSEGVRTMFPCGPLEQYRVHPEFKEVIEYAVQHGHVPNDWKAKR